MGEDMLLWHTPASSICSWFPIEIWGDTRVSAQLHLQANTQRAVAQMEPQAKESRACLGSNPEKMAHQPLAGGVN